MLTEVWRIEGRKIIKGRHTVSMQPSLVKFILTTLVWVYTDSFSPYN